MILKKTSKDLLDLLDTAANSVKRLSEESRLMKEEMSKRLLLLQNEAEFTRYQQEKLLRLASHRPLKESTHTLFLSEYQEHASRVSSYPTLVFPSPIREVDIFNMKTPTGYLFKNNVDVLVNGDISSTFTSALSHEEILGRPLAFDLFESPHLTLSIVIHKDNLLGKTLFNTIDLTPYLGGSFQIDNVHVTPLDGSSAGETYTRVIKGGGEVGRTRISLNESISLHRLDIYLTLLYKNDNGLYPFGLKHLYLKDVRHHADAFLIAMLKRNSYIRSLGDTIRIKDAFTERESTLSAEGIEIYERHDNDTLTRRIHLAPNGLHYAIPMNTKALYLKVPILKELQSIILTNIVEAP